MSRYEEHGQQPDLEIPDWLLTLARHWIKLVVGPRPARPVSGTPEKPAPRDWKLWVRRALGLRPMAIEIDAPAVCHGGSYHLEVEAPSGLQITRAKLEASGSTTTVTSSNQTLDRVHLYLEHPPESCREGSALVNLRPRPWTIIRTASIVAIFTLLLMILVAIRGPDAVENLGPEISLLLVVPAVAAGYVARGGEPSVTTQVLFGLRFLAASVGLWPFLAALTLAAGTSCHSEGKPAETVCQTGHAVSPLLWLLTLASLATALLLAIAITRVWRPPEQYREQPFGDSPAA